MFARGSDKYQWMVIVQGSVVMNVYKGLVLVIALWCVGISIRAQEHSEKEESDLSFPFTTIP